MTQITCAEGDLGSVSPIRFARLSGQFLRPTLFSEVFRVIEGGVLRGLAAAGKEVADLRRYRLVPFCDELRRRIRLRRLAQRRKNIFRVKATVDKALPAPASRATNEMN